MDGVSWAILLVLSLLWGGSFFFTEIALRDLPPFTLVLARVALASVILWLVIAARRIQLPRSRAIWISFLIMGLLNNLVPFSLIVWSQTYIASGLAAILNATTPLFTLLIAHIATDNEKLSARKITGVVTGFIGVLIVTGIPALGAINPAANIPGDEGLSLAAIAPFAVLIAALSYGCAGVFGRRFKNTPPIVTAAGQTTASSLMLVPLVCLVDAPWTLPFPTLPTWLAVVGIASVSTALAYILYFKLLRRAGASNLALVTFLIPVSAILLGFFFLGEALAANDIAGMLIIGVGLAIIDGRPLAGLRHLGKSLTR
ncbi:ABC transporter permease [Thalassospira mesophila]|uniref:ABC transporter permease n=2 Tax=Thalassospira mesophila TaxID=1293891 RepID=A0A1Y2L0M3_9PROT|nr:DMT family transporter [Thalassospira mesophila]OSQ37265.1 ABC transporter permease [Thalassospira mesophila]